MVTDGNIYINCVLKKFKNKKKLFKSKMVPGPLFATPNSARDYNLGKYNKLIEVFVDKRNGFSYPFR